MNSQNTGAGTSSSLRPRNRRLISIDDDYDGIGSGPSSAPISTGTSTSAFTSSRAASPIPSAHPSRPPSVNRSRSKLEINSRSWGLQLPTTPSTASLFSPEYFQSSWSSIQGIASTLLGNEIRNAPRSATLPRTRRKELDSSSKYTAPGPQEWGPSTDLGAHLAKGSQEDRLAQLQAKKRETLLEANGHTTPDGSGKYKRRNSGDQDTYVSSSDEVPDVRVYVHRVQPTDTLAGVMIKYNCPQSTFFKINRFWPNDSIQIRKVVYLPVEACSIRGRKVPSPSSSTFNLLDDLGNEDSVSTPTLANPQWPSSSKSASTQPAPLSSTATSPSVTTTPSLDLETPGTHDSWVSVEHFTAPIEIVRIPRRNLGFFPPARRKSIQYSDMSPARSPNISPNLSPNPKIRSTSLGRSRSGSSATKLASALRGPGGVGTLGIDSYGPGPAPDKLNQLFPNAAARSSFESATSTASIENLGGKVEGWVRKMASKAVKEISGEGDLIELMEGWDLSGNGSTEDRGREEMMSEVTGQGTSRDEEERLLRERFPMRKKDT